VHITIKKDLATLQRPLHHQLCVIVLGEKLAGATDPLPVHVGPHQATTVVAHNYAIWILHGNNLENKSVSEKLCIFLIAD